MPRRWAPAVILVAVAVAGCAVAQAGSKRFWPKKERWSSALRTAAQDPVTWGPAAGAAAIGLAGWDSAISDWAVREAPVFGSGADALKWSDDLRTASHLGMVATLFVVKDPDHRWKEAGRRLIVQHAAAVATTTVSSGIKAATDRERPDRSDRESFPSGHGSRAFSYAASARRNLADSRLNPGLQRGLDIGLLALAGGTAWARVEAGKHHPTDVLAGAALGNFLTTLINEAFLDAKPDVAVSLNLGAGHTEFIWVARW